MQDGLFFAALLPDPAAAPGARCFFFVFFNLYYFFYFFSFFCNSIWLQGREEASLYWLDPKTNHAAPANARLRGRWLGCGGGARGGVPEEQLSRSGGGRSLETQARWSDYAAISRPRRAVVPCVHHVRGHSGVLSAVFFIIKF